MIIKKLIFTEKSICFRQVKEMTKCGIYIVEGEDTDRLGTEGSYGVSFWKDGVELMIYEDFHDAVEHSRLAWSRNRKLNKILK